MTNYLLDAMPQAVLIDGEAVPINTDFRVCLRIIKAMEDKRLTEHEKLTIMLTLLYPEIPHDTALALRQGLKFLNLGGEAETEKLRQPPVYNLEKDSAYIYTAFKSTFNIDLETVEYLHWWKFRSLFADLGRDCFFNTLISLRSRRQSGKLTDSEKDFVRKNPQLMSHEACSAIMPHCVEEVCQRHLLLVRQARERAHKIRVYRSVVFAEEFFQCDTKCFTEI